MGMRPIPGRCDSGITAPKDQQETTNIFIAHPNSECKSYWPMYTAHGVGKDIVHNMQTSTLTPAPVAAVVVAAGFSRRMGVFKLTLPWAGATVIEQVVATLKAAPLREIVVVTGHRSDEVKDALARTCVRYVLNPHYQTGEMLSSIQIGLAAMTTDIDAVLICLGDQPQMETTTVQALLAEGEHTGWQRVIIPSYQMRAGHPILLPRPLWMQIMNTTESLRSVLRTNGDLVNYLAVGSASILSDLDTPDDYQQARL
jgi:molybdenum cofactor cytidylyltransferase